MRRRLGPCVVTGVLACASGCGPQWHSGYEMRPMLHYVDEAAVFADEPGCLSVTGSVRTDWVHMAVTDYGVKVDRAEDDTGRKLALQSFQIFWMKDQCFEAVFSAPDPRAKSVSVAFAFTTRSGVQRVTKTLPIERNRTPHYRHRPEVFRPGPYRPDLSQVSDSEKK